MFFQNVYKGKTDIGTYVLGIIIVLIAFLVIGQIPISIPIFVGVANGTITAEQMQAFTENPDFSYIGLDQNLGFFLLLLDFIIAFIALYIVIEKLHKRPFNSLVTTFSKINWSKVFWAFGVWFLMTVAVESLSYFLDTDNYAWQLNWSKFIPLLLMGLLMLPIQTSFEELFFRGYLMQAFGQWAGSRWVPLILTSVLFGSMHMMNPEVGKFGWTTMLSYYVLTGLFLGIITLMDDSLELALGVHAATNIFAAVFVSFEGSALQTPSLLYTKEVNIEYMFPAFFAFTIIFFFLCKWKYGWNDYSKLYKKVEKPIVNEEHDIA